MLGLLLWILIFIWLGSIALYYTESGANEYVQTFEDAIWMSLDTVTATGFGEATPQTEVGRILGTLLMILGTVLVWAYAALFATELSKDED